MAEVHLKDLIWLIPALPFAGFVILAMIGSRMPKSFAASIGAGTIGVSALISLAVAASFSGAPSQGYAYTCVLWKWMVVEDFSPDIALYVDALSAVMIVVITFVGFLIHLYSTESMREEDGYSRFFAYMNLFVGSMLTLVLADNLLLLYLGWEGVGLCSYLLIGFWYKDPANGRAAMKAFIVTRVGDAAMAIGLFIIYLDLGTLKINEVLIRAAQHWPVGSTVAIAVAALLLGGAVGKSAQLPLQTWLPDAMAGPTPVSALIHAATMVTAGVYLIARTGPIFTLAPQVQLTVAVIGAATLLISGISALTQRDIKRCLAYSTMSQVGYMFLALGVGAWSAAIFHFMTHAFFKALLFLSAGVVIDALHHERDMFRMGGLRHQLPLAFWTFLIGAGSLSALPLITAGFYSKDMILWSAWSSGHGSPWLWAAGLSGALITSVYAFRMVFLIFYGKSQLHAADRSGLRIKIPLIALAFFSLTAGFVELPETLGNLPLFSGFLGSAMPSALIANSNLSAGLSGGLSESTMQYLSGFISLLGIFIAYIFFLYNPFYVKNMVAGPFGYALHCFLLGGWNFDRLYNALFVKPLVWLVRVNRRDVIDQIYRLIGYFCSALNAILSSVQNGLVRRYALGIAIGAVIIVGVAVLR
ncbi:MAG TPA: NADH-quinone oxidoreductase subunit L [Dissulfurispiraceae bacterium]|nr:NADH-quinone oxidoreductase subunit L [Dissulfurispiraceae bacterium]